MPESPAGVDRESRKKSVRELLRKKVFPFFPEQPAGLKPQFGAESIRWGRKIREITFTSFEGLKVRGVYSLPLASPEGKLLPAVLALEDEPGVAWWGGKTRKEGYQWGDRAVLVLETLDIGSRAIDDSLRHQMHRQAMIAGCSFDGIRVYEIMRGIELLRSQPEVNGEKIAVVGRGAMGVNGLYAALLDDQVARVVLEDPPGSHLEGPCYLGILTRTDIPEVVGLMEENVRLLGGAPDAVAEAISNPAAGKIRNSLEECLE